MPSSKALFAAAAVCFLVALAVPTAAITIGEDPVSDDMTLTPVDDRYATIEDGELTLDLSLYNHATTTIADVFTIDVGAEADDLVALWLDHDVDGVSFVADGEELSPEQPIAPAPGETVTVGIETETPDAASGSETFSIHVAYEDSDIELTDVGYSGTEFTVGETLTVDATYENTGNTSGETVTRLVVDGVVVDRQTVSVDAGESETVSFDRTMAQSGEFEVGVDDSETETITVWPAEGEASLFEISAVELDVETDGDGSISPGESAGVVATVRNTGNVSGSMDVELAIGGAVVDSAPVSLGPGESTTVEFDWQFDQPGEYSIAVSGIDAGTVTVGDGDQFTVMNRSFQSSSAAAAAPAAVLGLLFAVTGLRRREIL